MKTKYVAGFLFSENGAHVALIEKLKPEWQKNKFNAIGGKIEEGESALHAMSREFKEETGLDIPGWTPFCVLSGTDFEVHFFSHFSDDVYKVKSMEAEKVAYYSVKSVTFMDTIPNLKWLVPMALEKGLMSKVFEGI
jgi:8-oxo-dGTP diphosphatase